MAPPRQSIIQGQGWQACPYRRQFRQPLRNARQSWAFREGYILRAEWPDGKVTYSEIAPLPGFGGESRSAVEDFLHDRRSTHPSDPHSAPFPRESCPASAFGWAMLADRTEVPDQRVWSAALLPAGQPAISALADSLAAGFRVVKWKVGVLPAEQEIPIWHQLLSLADGRVRFRLDPNQSWDLPTFRSWEKILTGCPVLDFVEEPFPEGREEDERLLDLARQGNLPFALDERLLDPISRKAWLRHPWPGYWVVKASLWGDPAVWGDILLDRIPPSSVILSSSLESPVGLSLLDRLARQIPEDTVHGLGTGSLFTDSAGDAENGPLRPSPVVSEAAAARFWKEAVASC